MGYNAILICGACPSLESETKIRSSSLPTLPHRCKSLAILSQHAALTSATRESGGPSMRSGRTLPGKARAGSRFSFDEKSPKMTHSNILSVPMKRNNKVIRSGRRMLRALTSRRRQDQKMKRLMQQEPKGTSRRSCQKGKRQQTIIYLQFWIPPETNRHFLAE